MKNEDNQRTKKIATTIIVAFIITAAVAISYWLSQVSQL